MSPPLSHRINVSTESEELPKLDPLACDINYFDTFLEHKPLPVGPAAGAAAAGPPPPPAVKNSKIGTSSLGRKGKWRENSNNHECSPPASLGGLTSPPTASPNNCTSCRSPSQFPKVYIRFCFLKKTISIDNKVKVDVFFFTRKTSERIYTNPLFKLKALVLKENVIFVKRKLYL